MHDDQTLQRPPQSEPGATNVYLLVDSRRKRFKVGVSAFPVHVGGEDSEGLLDESLCRSVSVGSRAQAFALRGTLLAALQAYRVLNAPPDGCVWLDLIALPTAAALIHAEPVEGLLLPVPALLSEEEDARRNRQRLSEVAALWRSVHRRLPMTVPAPRRIVVPDFGRAALPLRDRQALCELPTYRLPRPRRLEVAALHLVQAIGRDALRADDLVLTLASPQQLRRHPGGAELVQGLDALTRELASGRQR